MISLNFTKTKGRLCICGTVVGTSIRHYRRIEELSNANLDKWDSKAQKFVSRRPEDIKNNRILSGIMTHFQELNSTNDFPSAKELFEFDRLEKKKTAQKAKEELAREVDRISRPILPGKKNRPTSLVDPDITFGEWLKVIVEEIKNPSRLKPSSSYQVYLTLLHKLEGEGKLINQRVCDLSDNSFVSFINYVNSKKQKGNNYVGLLKIFRAAINRAFKIRLTDYEPRFPYMDYAPIHKVTEKASEVMANGGSIKSLTPEQYQRFLSLDLSTIKWNGGKYSADYIKELYRDFAILLYEMKSRPIDILRLHWDSITYDPNTKRYTCVYVPAKKKNYGASAKHTASALAMQYLSPKAEEIVLKYKGKSKGGYVFPFALNQKRHNFDDPDQFYHHYIKGNRVCGSINHFLHKVGKMLQLPFQLTLYAFRRTAITAAITENKIPLMMLAKMAGTSVEMIEAHYTNHLHALSAY